MGVGKGSPGDMRGFRLSADKPTMSTRPFLPTGIKDLPSDLVHGISIKSAPPTTPCRLDR